MKYLSLIFALSTIILVSCNTPIKNSPAQSEEPLTEPTKSDLVKVNELTNDLIVQEENDLIGNWIGMFEPDTAISGIATGELLAWNYSNKINISIDRINKEEVFGHSVVAGNDRPFKGKLALIDNMFTFTLTEPGDHKEDGVFRFLIVKGDSTITGTWLANKPIRIPKRKYSLTKKVFKYNPELMVNHKYYVDWHKSRKVDPKDENGYDASYFATTEDITKYNASKHLLTSKEVANMKKADLFVLRNTIYARHGYSFRNQALRAYFDSQPWYIPVTADIKSDFTEIEKKNIILLLRYEKNAEEYYDVFGRG